MTSTISITVPAWDVDAIEEAGEMFTRLAHRKRVDEGTDDRTDMPRRVFIPTAGTEDDQPDEVVVPYSELLAPETEAYARKLYNGSPDEVADRLLAAQAPETDADGLPWDERIHAGTKTTNADGRWKKRRGVGAETVATVEAELRGADVEVPTPPPPPPAPAAPATDAEPATVPTAPAGDVPPPPPAPASDAPSTFPEFLKAVTTLIANQQITMDRVNEITVAHGFERLAQVGAKPDAIPALWQDICNG